jgi:Na+/H+-translocating membrane pyrophosphatase
MGVGIGIGVGAGGDEDLEEKALGMAMEVMWDSGSVRGLRMGGLRGWGRLCCLLIRIRLFLR